MFRGSKIAILIVVWTITSSFHPFYLSVTELTIKEKENKLELAIKCFGNDLEDALKRLHKKPIDLLNEQTKTTNDPLLSTYFSTRFKILINKKRVSFIFLGYEKENEVIWGYFEANQKIKSGDSLVIENRILYDFLPEQTNITHIKWGSSGNKSFKKVNPDGIFSFKFDLH